jgi:hypothetical protein
MSYQSSQANKDWGGVGGGGGVYNYTSNNGGATIGNWNTGGAESYGTGNQNGVWNNGQLVSQPNFNANASLMNPTNLMSVLGFINSPEGQASGLTQGDELGWSKATASPFSRGVLNGGLLGDDNSVSSGPIQPALGAQGTPYNRLSPTAQAAIARARARIAARRAAVSGPPHRTPLTQWWNGAPPDYTYPGFEGTDPNGIGRTTFDPGNYPAGGFGLQSKYPNTTLPGHDFGVTNAVTNNPSWGMPGMSNNLSNYAPKYVGAGLF